MQTLLEQRGWDVACQSWQEALGLPLDGALLERWFAPQADYRRLLGTQLDSGTIDQLRDLFKRHLGNRLPQPLRHSLLVGQRPG